MAVRADVPRALCKRSGPRRNPGPDFLRGCLPWFHGTRLRDTFHGTMGSIERVARPRGRPDAGDHVTRRTETTRDGARRARRQAARQRGRKLFPMQHLRRLSRRAGLRMGSGSRRPAAAPGARSRAVAQNRAAELHLNPFLRIAAGTIAGFPREVIGAGTMASGMCSGRQADQVPV